jgi:tRNA uracil 4-sulfurtransferase
VAVLENIKTKIMIITVDELWLKGKNRHLYFKALRKHVKNVIVKNISSEYKLWSEAQRFFLESDEFLPTVLIEKLTLIPGINSVAPTLKAPVDYDQIFPLCKEAMTDAIKKIQKESTRDLKNGDITFKVHCKRILKSFPHGSMDICRDMGHELLKEFEELSVDVHKPKIMVDIKIFPQEIFVSTIKLKGVGGLPVPMSGHGVTLISGGFDSPVASYLMSRRGMKQTFIFFHAYPYVGDEAKEKIEDMVEHLANFQNTCELYVVPFGEIQKEISKSARIEYRTIFFRKLMIEVANKLAENIGARSLITGDSLGQVSSQTLENMSILDQSSSLLVLRPLLGHNKSDIIRIAEEIGSAPISLRPHDDACSLFSPKKPIIRPSQTYWDRYFSEQDFSSLVEDALSQSEITKF